MCWCCVTLKPENEFNKYYIKSEKRILDDCKSCREKFSKKDRESIKFKSLTKIIKPDVKNHDYYDG